MGWGWIPTPMWGGNPETWSDPTGLAVTPGVESVFSEAPSQAPVGGGGIGQAIGQGIVVILTAIGVAEEEIYNAQYAVSPPPASSHPASGPAVTSAETSDVVNSVILAAHRSGSDEGDDLSVVNSLIWAAHRPHPEPTPQPGSSGQLPPGGGAPTAVAGAPCSFTSQTQVTTDHGKQEIGQLHEGDKVLAYNPQTQRMELEPIVHVWKHTDNDLVDLTITSTPSSQQGKSVGEEDAVNSVIQSQHHKSVKPKGEVVHTTSEHPFFTTEQGFVPAGKLKVGMHVLRADGSVGVVTGWKVVSGTKVMYNLEVAHDHTFVVGEGQWVVHNKCDSGDLRLAMQRNGTTFKVGQQAHHIIPCDLENHRLVQTAKGAGFDMDAPYNGRPLWDRFHQSEALADMEPYHWFHTRYTMRVRAALDNELTRLTNAGTLTANTAFSSLMQIIDDLNYSIDLLGWFAALSGVACLLE